MAWKFSERVSGIGSVQELIFQNENQDFLKQLEIEIKLSGKVREFCFGILEGTLLIQRG